MNKILSLLGNLAGGIGLLLCAAVGMARLAGYYFIGDLEAMTLFEGGMGLMLAACLIKLHVLEARIG